MKNIFLFLFLFCFIVSINAEEITFPQNATKINSEDEEIKSLVWNRYVNKNFTILSIDEAQGYWLYKNIDQINDWIVSRWGFPKVDFAKECRVFCVPNKSLLKKLFGIDSSKVEVRRKDGDIEISVLWLVLEEKKPSQVAPYLARASFAEFEHQGLIVPWWFIRSAEILSSSGNEIKTILNGVTSFDNKKLNCEAVFNTKLEEYQKLSDEDKKLFDQKCLVLCLMLRKELGEVKLQGLLTLENKNKIEKVLNFVYGYSSIQEFEKKFSLFCNDLSRAVVKKEIPDSYLQINRRK